MLCCVKAADGHASIRLHEGVLAKGPKSCMAPISFFRHPQLRVFVSRVHGTKMTYRSVLLVLLTWCALGALQEAKGETFPFGIIRIVVPTTASSPPDIVARIVATELSDRERWRVIVENKPGAMMIIGGTEVLKAPADGHNIYAITVPAAVAPSLLPNVPFKLDSDFVPLIRVATGYNVLVVHPSVPVNSVSDLVTYLRGPGNHTFASGGFGTPAHLIGELFKLETGVRPTHVPYAQFPQAIADLLSGITTYGFITVLPMVQYINTGKLNALAVIGPRRIAILKDVPTIGEAGYPNLVNEDWVGFMVKAGTPAPVIARLNGAINEVLKTDKVRDGLAKLGTDPGGGTPEEFGATVRANIQHWSKVVTDAGIKIAQ
jgi:tripartite-type tricarboxylate transporter receptor subunit TctC